MVFIKSPALTIFNEGWNSWELIMLSLLSPNMAKRDTAVAVLCSSLKLLYIKAVY